MGTARRVIANANFPWLLAAAFLTGWTATHASRTVDYLFTAAFGGVAVWLTIRLIRDFTTFGPWCDLVDSYSAQIDRLLEANEALLNRVDELTAERDALENERDTARANTNR
jgi:hypothetical protein